MGVDETLLVHLHAGAAPLPASTTSTATAEAAVSDGVGADEGSLRADGASGQRLSSGCGRAALTVPTRLATVAK